MNFEEKVPPFSFTPSESELSLVGEEIENAQPQPDNLISTFASDKNLNFTEQDLDDERDKSQGVILTKDMNDRINYEFDKETIGGRELTLISDFLQLIESGGKEALKGTRFNWFFGGESEDFISALTELLKKRKMELEIDLGPSSLFSSQLDERMAAAYSSFREMAKREQLRKALEQQVAKVPIEYFEAKKKNTGEVVRLRFNPSNLNDPSNEVEYMLVHAPDGQTELVFSCKEPEKYETIRPKFRVRTGDNLNRPWNYFSVGLDLIKITDELSSDNELNTSRYELEVSTGTADVTPLFTRIKVFKKPVNLDREFEKYYKEKEDQRRREEEKERKRQQSQQSSYGTPYTPKPPVAPTPTPNFMNVPTNTTRSSG